MTSKIRHQRSPAPPFFSRNRKTLHPNRKNDTVYCTGLISTFTSQKAWHRYVIKVSPPSISIGNRKTLHPMGRTLIPFPSPTWDPISASFCMAAQSEYVSRSPCACLR
ncbi:hypothetical protein AVEN_137010-1 [Araneus ventricosus]|uniref:Uncharacterized protein n=1 Tax=Araneus ventricosus TaxID=182803 RepID=A0A4Y2R4V7_ARAVE|nr:hypothetical protein AVEN_137010-1 [Araneus ventricosus]